MIHYECGNYTKRDDPPDFCKFCGAAQREEQPGQYETVVVYCDGW